MLSPDPAVRAEAFEGFYAEAHDQGAVDPCTAASLPFLFDMADHTATPDRAEIGRLLFSIGREALHCDPQGSYSTVNGVESTAHLGITAEMAARADAFVRYAADPDPLVRRPAIEAVGLFLADGGRAVHLLAERLPAEDGIVERLLVVRTLVRLAVRLPETGTTVATWLDELIDGPQRSYADAPVRLSALTHQVLLDADRDTADLAPRAITLLRESTVTPTAEKPCDGCRRCQSPSHVRGRHVVPTVRSAHLAVDRFDPDHLWEERSPVSSVLRTLHTTLGDRIADRTALLVAQLTSPDAATRYDAIAMAKDLPGPLSRPVLTSLLALLPDDWAAARVIQGGFSKWWGGQLAIAAEDTELLLDTLDDHMTTLRAAYGPDVWATDNALIRTAYQEAVMTLADHRDSRALPDLIRSLDTRVDDWRVLYGVGGYPQAADRFVPLLAAGLRFIDPAHPHAPIPAGLYLSCLAELKDPIAIPVITDTLTWAVQHQTWTVVTDALNALTTFGLDAQPAHPLIRPLIDAPGDAVRAAARAALDALTNGQAPRPAWSKPGNGYAQEPPN
ncbi:HEAT repeat domain-containing protein [Streptomyces virginiae]|uniref:HEAT repeat domain-containing protein n=1 Tax=Streptomyces TaxID=1883 RepID=UPI00136F7EA5|nr:HEAT repeat domain-containing protein [Streptomyces sp. SID1046]MYV79220.1 HEAT repeat domain-containing protein [Streptomyces sp. SID1046]